MKNYAIKVLNELIGERYSDFKYCQDSTAAITIRRVVNARLDFSADVAIVAIVSDMLNKLMELEHFEHVSKK